MVPLIPIIITAIAAATGGAALGYLVNEEVRRNADAELMAKVNAAVESGEFQSKLQEAAAEAANQVPDENGNVILTFSIG